MRGTEESATPNEQLVRDISRHLPGREHQHAENMLKYVLDGLSQSQE